MMRVLDLLLGEGNLHCSGGCDLESLECVSSSSGLHFVLELDERDVVTTRNQSDLNNDDNQSLTPWLGCLFPLNVKNAESTRPNGQQVRNHKWKKGRQNKSCLFYNIRICSYI